MQRFPDDDTGFMIEVTATGHYARVIYCSNNRKLKESPQNE